MNQKIEKKENFTKWYSSVLENCEILDNRFPLKGFFIFKPFGLKLYENIIKLIENEFETQNIQKYEFPRITTSSTFSKSEKYSIEFLNESYWINKTGLVELKENLSLNTSNDASVFHILSFWIQNQKQLPLKLFQNSTIYRHEVKGSIPLIRSREIQCNQIQMCFKDEKSSLENVETLWKSYLKIVNEDLGIFGLRLRKPKWKSYPDSQFTDSYFVMFPNGKSLQVISVNYLGISYSQHFDIKFIKEDQKSQDYVHIVTGIISHRILSSLISIHGDEFGLIVPPKISKFEIVIVPIFKKGDNSALKPCIELKEKLLKIGKRVHLDDDESKRPGEKFYDWEKFGIPLRVEIGPKDVLNSTICVYRRDTKEKKILKDNFVSQIEEMLKDFEKSIKSKNAIWKHCLSFEEVNQCLSDGTFARIAYLTPESNEDGRKDDNLMESKTEGGSILGSDINDFPTNNEICLLSGKSANSFIFVSKTF
jgi:prolyl-tRNA synthetase